MLTVVKVLCDFLHVHHTIRMEEYAVQPAFHGNEVVSLSAFFLPQFPYLQENELRELKQLGGRIGLSPRKIAEYLEVLPADLRRVAHRKLVGAGFRLPV